MRIPRKSNVQNVQINYKWRPWIPLGLKSFFFFYSNNFIIPLDKKRKTFYRARSIQGSQIDR